MKKRLALTAPALLLSLILPTLSSCGGKESNSVSSLEIESGFKGRYGVGEDLDFSALRLNAVYKDGSKVALRGNQAGLTHSEGDTSAPGNKVLTFTYDGYSQDFAYTVYQAYLHLDLQGGTLEGETSKTLPFYNNRVDIGEYKPSKQNELGEDLVFSGWYLDQALSTRVTYLIGSTVQSEEDLTLYAGYDADYSGIYTYSIDKEKQEATLLSVDMMALFSLGDELTIPLTVEGYPVTALGDDFLKDDFGFVHISKVIFPKGSKVRSIGARAFAYINSLQEVVFPESLEIIGENAFASTSLRGEIVLPASVRVIEREAFAYNVASDTGRLEKVSFEKGSQIEIIGDGCFRNASFLSSVELPEGLEKIGDDVFAYCNDLSYLHLPSTLSSLGKGAFLAMESLKEIDVSPDNKFFSSLNGDLYSKDRTVFYHYSHSKGEDVFTLPESVRTIEDQAFALFNGYSTLKEVVLPSTLNYIGESAFAGCSFSFTLPAGLSSFSLSAFLDYSGNKILVNPENQKYVSEDGILYSKDKKILYACPNGHEGKDFTLPDSVQEIADYAFYGARNISTFTIPASSSLSSIGKSGLALNSMLSLTRLNFLSSKALSLESDSLYRSGSYTNDTYSIVLPSQEALSSFEAELQGAGDAFTSAHAFTPEGGKEELLDQIASTFFLTPRKRFLEGEESKLHESISVYDDRLRSILSRLNVYYASSAFSSQDIDYLLPLEKGIASSFYGQVEERKIYGSVLVRYYTLMENRLSYMPEKIKAAVEPYLTQIKVQFPFLSEEDKAEISAEFIAFQADADHFSQEEYEDLMKRADKVSFEDYPRSSNVNTKLVLLQADSLIDRLLSIDLSTLDGVMDACRLLYVGGEGADGLMEILRVAFPTENRQKFLYHYEEFAAFEANWTSVLENAAQQFAQEIIDFDYSSSFSWRESYQFFQTHIDPYVSYLYTYFPSDEAWTKCMEIWCDIDMYWISTSFDELTDENFYECYSNLVIIENRRKNLIDTSTLVNEEAYLSTKERVLAYGQSKAERIQTLLNDLSFSDAKNLSAWKEIYSAYEEVFGDYLYDFLGIDAWDFTSRSSIEAKVKAAKASYFIATFFSLFPDLASSYGAALDWLYGSYDEEGNFQAGEGNQVFALLEYFGDPNNELTPDYLKLDFHRRAEFEEKVAWLQQGGEND